MPLNLFRKRTVMYRQKEFNTLDVALVLPGRFVQYPARHCTFGVLGIPVLGITQGPPPKVVLRVLTCPSSHPDCPPHHQSQSRHSSWRSTALYPLLCCGGLYRPTWFAQTRCARRTGTFPFHPQISRVTSSRKTHFFPLSVLFLHILSRLQTPALNHPMAQRS